MSMWNRLGALVGWRGQRDAGRKDIHEMKGWNPAIRHAPTSQEYDFDTVLGRSRDLDENNGWINGGLDRRVESVIGVNIRLSAQPKHELLGQDFNWRMEWTADVQARWQVWANDVDHRCDVRREFSFGALMRLAYLTYARDGEATCIIRDYERGLRNTTSILLVEPERISTPPTLKHQEGPRLRHGIVRDAAGAYRGAWIRSGHPDDPSPTRAIPRWDYVPARGRTGRPRLVRVYSPRRMEQNRGVSRLAEVMVPAKMLDRVDRAEVTAALKSALLSVFIEAPGSTEDVETALAPTGSEEQIDPWMASYLEYRSEKPIAMDGASITHLFPGEKISELARRSPNANYADFLKFVLQKVAGSLGVSYPQISQDWAGINYSSARALLNELWRSFKEDRLFFTHHFCTPIYAAWLEVEVANGDVIVPGGPANFYRSKTALCMADWIGPGRGSVDPLKEANANNLDTAAGRVSSAELIAEAGRDPLDVMAEEKWLREERARQGLPPIDLNTKAGGAAGEDGGDSRGTQSDRDGDGIENEGERDDDEQQPETGEDDE